MLLGLNPFRSRATRDPGATRAAHAGARCLCTLACWLAITWAVAPVAAETPLIPRKVLLGNPERVQARISPDGRFLSYLAPNEGVLNVWIAPIDRLEEATPVTKDTASGVKEHLWAYTNRHVLHLQDDSGDEHWRLLATDIRTGATRDLTPFEGVQARLVGLTRADPDRVLVALNRRDPRRHDLYAADLSDGSLTLVESCPPGGVSWVIDESGAARYVVRLTSDGGAEWLRRDQQGAWTPGLAVPQEDLLTTQPIGFDASGRTLYMLDSRGRDTSALVAFDTETGLDEVIVTDARSDIGGVLIDPSSRAVQAAMTDRLRPRWRPIDTSVTRDVLALERLGEGAFWVVGRTLDDRLWVVSIPDDDGPAFYYLHDRSTGVSTPLFAHSSQLKDAPLAPMRPVVIESRDGLEMVSYLTVPPGSESGVIVGGGRAGGDDVRLR
ncbi:MAG: hypothetical protein AAGK04_06815, partial [Planctomycetota bacterium]